MPFGSIVLGRVEEFARGEGCMASPANWPILPSLACAHMPWGLDARDQIQDDIMKGACWCIYCYYTECG